MRRWHEPGCRRPDVFASNGFPYCAYCFGTPLEEQLAATPPPPQLEDKRRMNLSWPPIVTYSDWQGEEEVPKRQVGNQNQDSESESFPGKSLLPELPSADSIRLLRLKPGTDSEPIHANLEIVRINQIPLPLYEALSYTSVCDPADPSESCPVYIGKYWDVVHVSTNCGKALRRLRHQKGDRLLWVDALCINYGDPEERNAQVCILREVYSRATKVLAYVGDERSNIGPAMSFLKEITTFHPALQEHPLTLSKDVRSSFWKLFQQPYFSRLWVLQETLMARELELVCGGVSAPWPKRSFVDNSGLDVPSWLSRDSKWYPFTTRDLLNVLVEGSVYQCTDPRDKVFAVLGLMGEKLITPDYQLPTESVYVGIAAFFAMNTHTADLLALAGQKNRNFDLPSWVPDWSQHLLLPSLDTFLQSGIRNDPDDLVLDGAIRVKFEGLSKSVGDIKVSSTTGTLRLQGFKLCTVAGEKSLVRDYTHVRLPSEVEGFFIISIPHQNYEVHESDNLYLLNGYNYPVILREKTSQVHTLVSACVLFIGPPSSKLLISWYRRQRRLGPSLQLTVSALAPEDDHSFQQLCSKLGPLSLPNASPPPTPTLRARALSFLMLPHTAIQKIEKTLRIDWYKWNQELGWMFRDQSAIWQFLIEVNQLSTDERTGEERINLRGPDYSSITESEIDFATIYTWDLSQFCWSFLHETDAAQPAPQLEWSPMVDQLRSHILKIQKWAQVTEQLLRVFKYTADSLEEDWDSFPGTQLLREWSRNYEKFLAMHGSTIKQGIESQQGQRPHLRSDHLWSPSEFESQLRAREEIWTLRVPEERGLGDSNIDAHALLHFLGLDLYNEQRVDLV
ncbi:heterokaryon incompatibility protein-domain-containing protein [Aspergillus falconensis]